MDVCGPFKRRVNRLAEAVESVVEIAQTFDSRISTLILYMGTGTTFGWAKVSYTCGCSVGLYPATEAFTDGRVRRIRRCMRHKTHKEQGGN